MSKQGMNKKQTIIIAQWQAALDDLIGALAAFRDGLPGCAGSQFAFDTLHLAVTDAGGDLDALTVGAVGIDDLRGIMVGV